jgi:hypothetical protein
MIGAVARRPWLSNALFRFSKWGNPFSEERSRWPYPVYERMSGGEPVVYSKLFRQWFVFGHDEAQAVLRSPHASMKRAAQVVLDVPMYKKLTPQVRVDVMRWLLVQDPPEHTRFRSAVARAFTPSSTKLHEDAVHAVVDALVDGLPTHGTVDLVERFTARLPIHVIARLLGLPAQRWEWLRQTSGSMASLLEPIVGIDPAAVNRDVAELHDFFQAVIDDRRREPRDDLISALVHDDGTGSCLTNDEAIAMIGFLLFAGHETATGALGNALLALERFPEQRQLLVDRPDIINNAVEELLRYDTSVQQSARIIAAPVEVGRHVIPAQAVVGVFLGAANRDGRRWQRPDELQLDRPNVQSITFGHGIHHCLGASLARLEMRVALPRLLERTTHARIDVSAVQWKRSFVLRGPTRIPVRFGAC